MAVVHENDMRAAPPSEYDALERVHHYLMQSGDDAQLSHRGSDGVEIPLPASLARMLRGAAQALAEHPSATLVLAPRELTTQQAAELLCVSRPYLVERLLANGEIPYIMTGAHRRLALEDVLAYRERRDVQRGGQLDALAQMSQEVGLDRA